MLSSVHEFGESYSVNPREQIIVALDVASAREALHLAEALREDVSFFKIGLQLFTAAGPEIVRAIAALDARVFLDLKFHDIPNTVEKAVASAAALGVSMVTVHLGGGREMLAAAAKAAGSALTVLGVSVLTSSNDETLRECGVYSPVEEQVLRLAALGAAAGIGGIVTSPHEVQAVRENVGGDLTLVVPGVRPAWAGADDQKRFMTPREAIERGADYLVIGRPITANAHPHDAVSRIVDELSEAPRIA